MSDISENDIVAGLNEVARDVFMDDDLVLTRASWADDIVGWSSITFVELIIGAQERFGIALNADETDNLTSIGDLADIIAVKLRG